MSSSSDSDSDSAEPIRKIKINIRPKEGAIKSEGADVNAIKASIEAWRPLGPPVHPSLSRRQSSLSSVSSLSFGTGSQYGGSNSTTATGLINTTNNYGVAPRNHSTMRSSPSCSSLVNEFNTRTSFTNLMSTTVSRTSSPLTLLSNLSEAVPIAIAIQESIELTVKGQRGQSNPDEHIEFESRALGNIKVAFPNAFAKGCYEGLKTNPALKLRMHSTQKISRYYASGLIKDFENNCQTSEHTAASSQGNGVTDSNMFSDVFDLNESPLKNSSDSKIIQFDMDALTAHLKQQYEQSSNSRYYNVDVLRYQIAQADKFEKCPLQVCAYWKAEPSNIVKLRVDFKHSSESGLNLERLRDVSFKVDLSQIIPSGLKVSVPSSTSSSRLRNIEIDSAAIRSKISDDEINFFSIRNGQNKGIFTGIRQHATEADSPLVLHDDFSKTLEDTAPVLLPYVAPRKTPSFVENIRSASTGETSDDNRKQLLTQFKLPPPPSSSGTRINQSSRNTKCVHNAFDKLIEDNPAKDKFKPKHITMSLDQCIVPIRSDMQHSKPLAPLFKETVTTGGSSRNGLGLSEKSTIETIFDRAAPNPNVELLQTQVIQPISIMPTISYDPFAHWDVDTGQLIWKFDNLLTYYKTEGFGSLLAKLDFRNRLELQPEYFKHIQPNPVEIRFVVADSTLSKTNISVDCTGYRITLLKKEIRSGRYKSEPFIL